MSTPHLMVTPSISSNHKIASSSTTSDDLNSSEGAADEDDIPKSPQHDGLTPTLSLAVNIPGSGNTTYFDHHSNPNSNSSVSTPTPIHHPHHSSNNHHHGYSSSPSSNSRNSKSTDGSSISVPPSPSIAESEIELGSPSSLGSMSSFNSYIGKRSGDIADVEDLDLDDYAYHNNHEPELETVSEIDEEESSSSFCSGSGSVSDDQRAGVAASILDSDLEEKDLNHSIGNHHHLGVDHQGSRRRLGGLGAIQNHLHHNGSASGLAHFHLSHFSPRHGGHGLSSSHARNHSGRLNKRTQQAQHQKGRIAELLEEGGGEGLPTEPLTKGSTSSISNREEAKKLADPQLVQEVASSINPNVNLDRDLDWGSEFPPPPPQPQRSVSPSDTIPAVPSPLCECLSVDENETINNNNQDSNLNLPSSPSPTPVTAALEENQENVKDSTLKGLSHSTSNSDLTPTNSLIRKTKNERNRDLSSSSSKPNEDGGTSSPGSTPPSSPVLVRNNSRGRRASSPTRSRPKAPLRPCFKRRTSAQTYHGSTSQGARDSSSERESSGTSNSRGRGHVRFSNAPPQEGRTHSPVEYDRKSCPISNRLSLDDVEELRSLKMEMNLLESKWKSMSACEKHRDCQDPSERIECRDCENPDDSIFRKVRKEKALLFRDSCGNTDAPRINGDGNDRMDVGYCKTGYSSDSASNSYSRNGGSSSFGYLSPSNVPPSLYRRGSADSAPTLKSLSSSNLDSSKEGNDLSCDSNDVRISAAQHLRLERERERERERKNLLKFNHNKSSPMSKKKSLATNSSIIARFGLTTPPPPLPGTGTASNTNSPQSSSRSISREASKENLRESSRTSVVKPIPKAIDTTNQNSSESPGSNPASSNSNGNLLSPRSSSAPPTSRTPSEERALRLSNAKQSINDAKTEFNLSNDQDRDQDEGDGKKKEEEQQEGEEETAIRGRSNSISPSLGSSKGGDDEGEEEEEEEDEEEEKVNKTYSDQIHHLNYNSSSNGIVNGGGRNGNARRDPSTDTIVANHSPTRSRGNFSYRNSSNSNTNMNSNTPSVTITAPTSSNINSSSSRASKQQVEDSEAESDYGGYGGSGGSSFKSNPYKSNFSVGSSWKSNNNKDRDGASDGYKSWNSTPATTPISCSFPTGYDSPASEFYESGSEYDLIG